MHCTLYTSSIAVHTFLPNQCVNSVRFWGVSKQTHIPFWTQQNHSAMYRFVYIYIHSAYVLVWCRQYGANAREKKETKSTKRTHDSEIVLSSVNILFSLVDT